jgi:hypothetical protein
MPWTLDTMKVDECFNRVHLSLGFSHYGTLVWGMAMAASRVMLIIVNYNYGYDMKIMVMMVNC